MLTVPTEPVPGYSRLTGYPNWMGLLPGLSAEMSDAYSLMVTTLTLLSVCVCVGALCERYGARLVASLQRGWDRSSRLRHNRQPRFGFVVASGGGRVGSSSPTNSGADGTTRRARATLSEQLHGGGTGSAALLVALSLYCAMTLYACLLFGTVGAGKLWAVAGSLHNAMELATLLLFVTRGQFRPLWQVILPLLYTVGTFTAVSLLPWPLDGAYFKWQGLVLDFALIVQWMRLLALNRADAWAPVVEVLDPSSSDTDDQEDDAPRRTIVPDRLQLLVWAAVSHFCGNAVSTIFMRQAASIVAFHLSYTLTFPLVATYVYLDRHTVQYVKWPRRTGCGSGLLIGLTSLIASTLVMALALQMKHRSDL